MPGAEPAADLEALLGFLKSSRGFDFTGYKRSTLSRRIDKRMEQLAIGSLAEYHDYLQAHPDEFPQLFNTILINVTSFFRDPPAWRVLAEKIVPEILASKPEGQEIRCWCAGVASGEEAYSLAITFCEALGEDEFRGRVKIYATDVDEESLYSARPTGHSAADLESVPAPLRDRYFELAGGRYIFRRDLRRPLIFGRHDLVQDAPISRLDLAVCRNTLMYMTAETQARIVARLHYALNDRGFLFLGMAEMLLSHSDLFAPVDHKLRIFRKVPKSTARERLAMMAKAGNAEASGELARQVRVLEMVAEALPVAQVVMNSTGEVTFVNELARDWFRLNNRDVGKPLQDLEISYRPLELRSLIEQARKERRPVTVTNVEYHRSEEEVRFLDVRLVSLHENGSGPVGTSISFTDVTAFNDLHHLLERSKQELETAYEELQSSNEELETTNEELQSTVEELETTNEELQSSNEELETMNEELESANSELKSINEEFNVRTADLEHVNTFMESVLTGLNLSVIVLDGELRVRLWNGKSEDLWGVGPGEAFGQQLQSLEIGLPMAPVRKLVQGTLAAPGDSQETQVVATDRLGRPIECRVVARLLESDRDGRSVLLLIEPRHHSR